MGKQQHFFNTFPLFALDVELNNIIKLFTSGFPDNDHRVFHLSGHIEFHGVSERIVS